MFYKIIKFVFIRTLTLEQRSGVDDAPINRELNEPRVEKREARVGSVSQKSQKSYFG